MNPTRSPKSTLFATGRPSENRAPTAARTILSPLGQTQTSMKKRLWFWVPARALLFQFLKPASIKTDAYSPKWAPKWPQSDPRYHEKSLLLDSQGLLEGQGGIAIAPKTSMAPKSHQLVQKHYSAKKIFKPLHSAIKFDLTSFSLQSPVLRWGAGGKGVSLEITKHVGTVLQNMLWWAK